MRHRGLVMLMVRQLWVRGLSVTPTQRRATRALATAVESEVDPGIIAGLQIVKYPHPALRAKSAEIEKEDFADADQIARRMLALMYEANGVGLAAPQVGINKRLMVFNPEGKKEKWLDEVILVNPKIVESSTGVDVATEGCLSFPGMNGEVQRHKWIKVEATSTRGKKIKKKYQGWVARIFQHEFDHLNGVVFVDHLSKEQRSEVQPVLDDLVKGFDGNDPAL